MSIQFRCPGCNEPIEVDDIYAGQTATCPYCRRVANVPTESSPELSSPVAARPGADQGDSDLSPPPRGVGAPGGYPPPLPPQYPGGPPAGRVDSSRAIAARRYANYSLVCMSIAILLFLALTAYFLSQMMPEIMQHPGSQPSPERMQQLTEQAGKAPLFSAASLGMSFFALVGLVLAIVSLTQSRTGNWRAIVGLVVCGVFVLCTCSSVLLSAVGMVGA